MSAQPIAVFDSGLGGLSVVRHLRRQLPDEPIVYFGDTARVPYGTKSKHTVVGFALDCARYLLRFDPKIVVAACNTASAVAIPELDAALPVPVLGVVEPGAAAAARHAQGHPVAVIGTEATIGSGAYLRAIQSHDPTLAVDAIACPLFVPLVEEGRDSDDPLVTLTVKDYLQPLRDDDVRVVVLGCTHYPLLRDAIAGFLGGRVRIIDSGEETAIRVQATLAERDALSRTSGRGSIRSFVSDNPERFERVGSRFLNEPIDHVELVEPDEYAWSAAQHS